MAVWMAYALFVGGLAAVAAVVAEWALRARGYPGRFPWMGALVVSVALPVLAFFRPAPAPAPEVGSVGAALPLDLLSQGLPAVSGAPSFLDRAEPWLVGLWLVATVTLGAALVGGLVRLSLKARRWPIARSGDSDVLLSDGFGPALLGLARLRVVVPRWALGLEPDQLRLVILHEEEHRRTGDARALLAAALAVVAAPWNVMLWWQLRRLRAALELDCDARVLRRGASPAAYGALLLELGSRIPGLPLSVLPVAALSNPPSLLERRLSMIVRGARRHGRAKALAAAGGAVLLVAVACEAPSPTGVRPVGGDDAAAAVAANADTVPLGAVVAGQIRSEPLVFVDGVLVPGKPSEIVGALDQATIERIEVTKGAAARAMMGDAAAGGILRISTTKGPDSLRAVREKVEADTVRGHWTLKGDMPLLNPDTQVITGVTKIERADARHGLEVTLDGEPFHGDLSTLDPTTIDHIDVVKGAEAGKGVIHITTKKAARGGGG